MNIKILKVAWFSSGYGRAKSKHWIRIMFTMIIHLPLRHFLWAESTEVPRSSLCRPVQKFTGQMVPSRCSQYYITMTTAGWSRALRKTILGARIMWPIPIIFGGSCWPVPGYIRRRQGQRLLSLSLIDRDIFKKLVSKYNSNKHHKGLNSWTHVVSILFCHLSSSDSVRDISNGLRSITGNMNHKVFPVLQANRAYPIWMNIATISFSKFPQGQHCCYRPGLCRF